MTKFQRADARAFYGGGFAGWAKCLAHDGHRKLHDNMSLTTTFRESVVPDRYICIVPETCSEELTFTVFYEPREAITSARSLARGLDAEELIVDWRSVCSAYVRASVVLWETHPFICLGHNATEKAAYELLMPNVLDQHRKFFGETMQLTCTLLERHRLDHELPELSPQSRLLTKLQHYQPN